MWSPCVGGEKNYAQRRKKTKVVNRTITKKNGKKAFIMITTKSHLNSGSKGLGESANEKMKHRSHQLRPTR